MLRWLKRSQRSKGKEAGPPAVGADAGRGMEHDPEDLDPLENVPAPFRLVSPDGIELAPRHVRLGDYYKRVYIMRIVPEYLDVGWLDELWNAPGVEVCVYLVPPPPRSVTKKLTRKMVELTSQYNLEVVKRGSVTNKPELEIAIEEIEGLRRIIHGGEDRMIYACLLVSITARTEEELRLRCQQVEDAVAAAGAKLEVIEFWQEEALRHLMPFGMVPKGGLKRYQYHNLLTGGASTLMPLLTADFSHAGGIFWGFNRHTRAPVFVDLWRPDLMNSHMFILGRSGSGKTVTTMLMALRQAVRGVMAVFLDVEGEYFKLARQFGGFHVRLDPSAEPVFNPLDIRPEWDEYEKREYVDVPGKVREVAALLEAVLENRGEKLDVEGVTALEEALKAEYTERGITRDPESLYHPGGEKLPDGTFAVGKHYKRMPTLSDVAARLERMGAERVAFLLRPFLRTGTLGFFDGETKVDPRDARILVFDLKAVEKDAFLRFYATQVVFMWLWEHLVKGRRQQRKLLVVDEAWTFLRHANSATFLLNGTKRGRKYNTAMVLTTQSFRDFNSEEGRNILAQCPTCFLMRTEPAEAKMVGAALNLSEGCIDFITRRECGKGDGILYVEGEVAAVHFDLAEWERELLGLQPAEPSQFGTL
ncbi:AAA-like domain-containing protein [Thermanaeromonas toyohensis ToBE]|uniref:AAA-like domain-containing protein n=2 Tax=Thermanaeromonas TaxID=202949 RepID=A0A1W1VSN8_9FIRM|nr:AAA-like domain-containing protein [Thermanaeromonas toyohensis ToBE]